MSCTKALGFPLTTAPILSLSLLRPSPHQLLHTVHGPHWLHPSFSSTVYPSILLLCPAQIPGWGQGMVTRGNCIPRDRYPLTSSWLVSKPWLFLQNFLAFWWVTILCGWHSPNLFLKKTKAAHKFIDHINFLETFKTWMICSVAYKAHIKHVCKFPHTLLLLYRSGCGCTLQPVKGILANKHAWSHCQNECFPLSVSTTAQSELH